MYVAILFASKIEAKEINKKDGSGSVACFEVTFKDQRNKKDGNAYCAFLVRATFWDNHPPFSEGDFVLISADLVNRYWQDKDNKWQSSPELRDVKILKTFDNVEQSLTEEEIPF